MNSVWILCQHKASSRYTAATNFSYKSRPTAVQNECVNAPHIEETPLKPSVGLARLECSEMHALP